MNEQPFVCNKCGLSTTEIGYVQHTCAGLIRGHAISTASSMVDGKPVSGLNGAGIERTKLHQSPGRPKGARNLHAKHPSSIAKAFARAGLDWKADFADAIRRNRRERIAMWLRLLPYLVTTTNKIRIKKWKGKASKAALVALEALEGK